MAFGLLPTGYAPKTQSVCRDEMTSAIQLLRGPSFDCSDGSLWGQWLGIFSERESALWDLGQAIDASQDPDKATGAALQALCALTGTLIDSARASIVVETLTGTPTTLVPLGTQINTASTGDGFTTVQNAVLIAGTAWLVAHAYLAGDRVTNASRMYVCVIAGTSAGSGGPTTTGTAIVDNTVTWRFLGAGTGNIDVVMVSIVKDAIVAGAYDLSVIATPVGGLQGAANILDATVGAGEQTDESLRVTREAELASEGTGPADAIRGAILRVAGVTSCQVFNNTSDVVDGNGQAAHSVQAVVEGGDDTAIATVLLAQVAAGIPTVGTTLVNIADSQGTMQPMRFTRVTVVPIYVDATYTYNPAPQIRGGYPTTGDALAKTAIATFGNTLGIGRDVVASSLLGSIFPVFVNGVQVIGVQGVLDVTSVKISTAPGPTLSTTITVTVFQRASFSTTNVAIHSSAGVV